MAPPRRTSQSSQGDVPDIARAIEAMVAAMAQQSAAMMQQHEASMQRQAASLEQQQTVMEQMEAARVAAEDAHRQHMEALRQLEENRAAAPVFGPEPRPAVREWSLEDFLKHHPAKFDGKTSPDATDQWMKDLECIYDAKMCPAENRLAFSVYMLTGEAEHWWSSTRSILEERDEPVTWEAFRERFLSEYFPDSIRYAKEVEFLQLTQGGKVVTEYAERFKHLSRFYTLPLDEEWRCRKFENGLCGDIRLMVAPLSIKDFAVLVEKARVMEKMKREVEGQRPQQPQSPQRIGGPSGSKPRYEERRRPYDRPHHQSQGSRGLPPQQGRVQCYKCGGPHPRYACPRMEGYRRCNNCGKEGHFGKDCPTLARAAARPPVQTPHQHQRRDRGNRPQATGRVYAMTGAEAAGSGNLVMGYYVIAGMRCCVLYDSGATNSFVSNTCVERLGLPVRELQCELAVSTPASGLVRTSSLCARLPVEVEGRRYRVNLICLPLQELEVILGMDWLYANRILIDCREKKLLFPDAEEPELMSSQGVMRELHDGAQCYMIFTHIEVERGETTSVIPVVQDFGDVFPEEVPGLPPSREVEFSIDLVPGTGPVSMAPYRMAPAELVELKK